MASAHHPTKEKLIETTAHLLRTKSRAELSSELILSESGISKGSLYHHFEDLDHLIEQAMLKRYTDWVDQSIVAMTYILTTGKSAQEIYDALMDSKKNSLFTNGKASISKKVGGKFSAYDGYATGKNLELVEGKKIVQTWRASDWKESDVDSIVTFSFTNTKIDNKR